jgi:hypothetical protein
MTQCASRVIELHCAWIEQPEPPLLGDSSVFRNPRHPELIGTELRLTMPAPHFEEFMGDTTTDGGTTELLWTHFKRHGFDFGAKTLRMEVGW